MTQVELEKLKDKTWISATAKTLHLALRIAGFNFMPGHVEMMWQIQQLVIEKGDLVTLEDISNIETECLQKMRAAGEPE